LMAGLEQKVSEQPEKYTEIKERADQVHALSTNFISYIDGIKQQLHDKIDDPTDYEAMDKPDDLDEHFFQSGKPSAAGREFLEQIAQYREGINSLIGDAYPQIAADINQKFSLDPVTDGEGVTK